MRAGLQELPPPQAVQQLQAALADREPVVEILSPQNDALLGPGPWTLRLRVRDWPLVDAGELGLGPHLVVQLDQEPPRIWTDTQGELPELSPGSHRLTVYAALPWGEARRDPGAVRQIRLHRTAANPLSLPEPGSPQLLAVSPPAIAGVEPLLFDVLLLDAPLQDVGGAGTQWRLRLSINGDDVLLDQQTPLWLRGWKPGLNALRLELLDARGNPLNPPFNSLVREVDRRSPPQPERWRGAELSEPELAVLLGRMPAPPPAPTIEEGDVQRPAAASPAQGSGNGNAMPAPGIASPNGADMVAGALDAEAGLARPAAGATERPQPSPSRAVGALGGGSAAGTEPVPPRVGLSQPPLQTPEPAIPAPEQPQGWQRPGEETAPPAAPAELGGRTGTSSDTPQVPLGETVSGEAVVDHASAAGAPPAAPMRAAAPSRPSPTAGPEDATAAAPAAPAPADANGGISIDVSKPADAGSPAAALASGAGEARIAPGSSLGGRARDLVNDDGTLRRPERRGPLAALREKLQG